MLNDFLLYRRQFTLGQSSLSLEFFAELPISVKTNFLILSTNKAVFLSTSVESVAEDRFKNDFHFEVDLFVGLRMLVDALDEFALQISSN